LSDAVDYPNDLRPYQWAQLSAMALDFKPDLILELGRDRGNSTCMFTEVSNQLHNECHVVSICISNIFDKDTKVRLKERGVTSDKWYRNLTTHVHDILTFEYESLLNQYQRIIVFWDAHGYAVANCVLGKLLPLLENKEHLILMHDICDARYHRKDATEYQDILWCSNSFDGRMIRLGNLFSSVEQLVAITDFSSRNDMELNTADHSFNQYFSQYPVQQEELSSILNPLLIRSYGQWAYFSLNGLDKPIHYPLYDVSKIRKELSKSNNLSYELIHWLMQSHDGQEVAIFGAGFNGEYLFDTIANFNAKYNSQVKIECFYDNYLSGEEIRGVPVLAPEDNSVKNRIILIASSRYKEIKQQLLELGVHSDRIVPGIEN